MDFHQLKIFVKVAETKSFSKAARLIFLSQPTVSSHIIALEKELGVKLFDRIGRETILTPFGEILYEGAIKILSAKEETHLKLLRYMKKIEGELNIYSSSIPAVYFLPKIVREYLDSYPKVKINIIQKDSMKVIDIISENGGIGIVGMYEEKTCLDYVPLWEDELVVISRYDSVSQNKKEISLSEILDKPFILREKTSGTRKTFEKYLYKVGLSVSHLRTVAEFCSSEAIINAVKEGMGVSVVSYKAVSDYKKLNLINCYTIKDIRMLRKFYMILKKGITLSPNAETFSKFIQER